MTSNSESRSQFLVLASLFQGGVAIVGFLLAWLLKINPFDHFHWNLRALALGAAGTVPMLILFACSWKLPWKPFQDIRYFLVEALGPFLAECRWYDLAWVALLAGYSEELLFRAALQTYFSHWGLVAGLLVSNLLFGLAHAITRLYVLLAGLLGVYLGILFQVAGDGNLLVPILTHATYDLIAFFIVRRAYLIQQKSLMESSPEDSADGAIESP